MDNGLLQKIERLEAEIEALKSECIPTVDRASKRRDKRQVFAGFGLFAVAVMIAGTMSASALSGTNTVDSGDIVDGTITNADIKSDAILGSRVRNDSLTGADINEGSIPGFRKTYFARVLATGVLDSTNGGTASAAKAGTGEYAVTFPFNVTSCAATANVGFFQGASALAAASYSAIPQVASSSSSAVAVYTRNTTGPVDAAFMLILTCP